MDLHGISQFISLMCFNFQLRRKFLHICDMRRVHRNLYKNRTGALAPHLTVENSRGQQNTRQADTQLHESGHSTPGVKNSVADPDPVLFCTPGSGSG
jgi:hypothetical protein